MAEIAKTVAPSGGDYTSLDACLDDNAQDLTDGGGDYLSIDISGDWSGSPDTTACSVTGYTTDTTNNIRISTSGSARHQGIYSSDYYLLEYTQTQGIFSTGQEYTATGIQFHFQQGSYGTYSYGIRQETSPTGGIFIDKCIFVGSGGSKYGGPVGFQVKANGSVFHVYNSMFHKSGSAYMIGLWDELTSGNILVYNCTVFGLTRGFDNHVGSAVTTIKNTIFNNGNDAVDPWGSGSTFIVTDNAPDVNNCVGVAADSGTTDDVAANKLIQSGQNFQTTVKVGNLVKNTTDNTYSYVTAVDSDTQLTLNDDIMADAEAYTVFTHIFGDVTFVNETAGSEDLHLDSSDTVAIDAGTDLSGEGYYTDDIDGDTRSGDWDIGADEYVAAGGGWTHKINGVAAASMAKVNGILKAAIEKINQT